MHSSHFLAQLTPYQIGTILGTIIGILVLIGLYLSAVMVIVRACNRRTPGWIVAGSVAGLLVLGSWGVLAAAFVRGFKSGLDNTRRNGGSTFVAGSDAPETVHGQSVPYTLVLPPHWVRATELADFDLAAHQNNVYSGVIAEEASVGSPEVLADITRKRLAKKSEDLQLDASVPEQIDGRTWLRFTARCKINHVAFVYLFHVYAGDEGTFQIIGWTLPNLYTDNVGKLQSVAAGFRFPTGANPAPAAAPGGHPQTVDGGKLSYRLQIPAGWQVTYPGDALDMMASHGSLFVAVAAHEPPGTTAAQLAGVKAGLAKAVSKPVFGDASSVRIDGRDWLEFPVQCEINGVPFGYDYFVYGGPEGTYHILGWTMKNLYARDSGTIREAALTFRFPQVAAPPATPEPAAVPTASPTPSPTTTPPPTSSPKPRRRR